MLEQKRLRIAPRDPTPVGPVAVSGSSELAEAVVVQAEAEEAAAGLPAGLAEGVHCPPGAETLEDLGGAEIALGVDQALLLDEARLRLQPTLPPGERLVRIGLWRGCGQRWWQRAQAVAVPDHRDHRAQCSLPERLLVEQLVDQDVEFSPALRREGGGHR
jgi:hypothetical protein